MENVEMLLRGHGHAVMSVAFSPDGTRIVLNSRDGTGIVLGHCMGTGGGVSCILP